MLPSLARAVFLTLTASILLVSTTLAAITFNLNDGTGFIGRGDIISQLGKSALTYSPVVTYSDRVELRQTCEKIVNRKKTEQKVITKEHDRVRGVNAKVDTYTRTVRGNDNISGYMLAGYSSKGLPTTLCPQDDTSEWRAVTPLEIVSVIGGGTLRFGGQPLLLP